MTAQVIAFQPSRYTILRDASEIALNTDAPKNVRRDACALLNAYGDWQHHLIAREVMATLNAIQGGDISDGAQRIARQVQAFEHDCPTVWAGYNTRTIREDRRKAARPAVMALLLALGWVLAIVLATAVVAEDTSVRVAATLAQAEKMGGM